MVIHGPPSHKLPVPAQYENCFVVCKKIEAHFNSQQDSSSPKLRGDKLPFEKPSLTSGDKTSSEHEEKSKGNSNDIRDINNKSEIPMDMQQSNPLLQLGNGTPSPEPLPSPTETVGDPVVPLSRNYICARSAPAPPPGPTKRSRKTSKPSSKPRQLFKPEGVSIDLQRQLSNGVIFVQRVSQMSPYIKLYVKVLIFLMGPCSIFIMYSQVW